MSWKWDLTWPYILLCSFAIASGQIARMGHRAEKGLTITRRHGYIELTMLPAFGSVGGSIAAEYSAPLYVCLACGVAAGWTGFSVFRILTSVIITALRIAINKLPEDGHK